MIARELTGLALLEAAGPFLHAREAENSFLLVRAARAAAGEPPGTRCFVVEDAGAVQLAALRQPGLKLLTSHGPAEAAAALGDLLAGDGPLPGVFGVAEPAAAFAQRFAARTGARVVPLVEHVLHRLDEVNDVPAVPGRMRPAAAFEALLYEAWLSAFLPEARLSDPLNAHAFVSAALTERRLFVWEDGAPAAMACETGVSTSGARVGMVYTPPELRGRGYATALVAALSRELLARGHAFCALSTDADNLVSKRIYARIGYRPVGRMAELGFRPK